MDMLTVHSAQVDYPAPHRRALPLRVGTRGSPLALTQTKAFIRDLQKTCPALEGENTSLDIIRTTGDATQASGCRLADIGGKGLFSKEIDEAMLAGRIDIAVHSLKDLETTMRPGILLGCILPREHASDVLVLGPDCAIPDPWEPWACLPDGAAVGTASVRRQAQLLHARPDLKVGLIRGNVQTRLDKVASGATQATLLAYAGLRRLGLAERASLIIHPELMVPAAGQGIVGITVRENDEQMREMLLAIEDAHARACATAERALLARLDGSCSTPIGAHARICASGDLHLTGLVASVDGVFLLKRKLSGPLSDAARIGDELGQSLKTDSPAWIFAP
ncbi:MAG TPA: hydroxymethylbilane synthase [Acetobacteraceae bacterium]|nr:hydroxymethylbilane synthase [Acetobacteraceae bacterium]HQU01226.1 hydroxymethylbilane synthase [Acetobacteraceae bacterium]